MKPVCVVHVDGPTGSGKTAFVECLLRSRVPSCVYVRVEHDSKLQAPISIRGVFHEDLVRVAAAGVHDTILYRYGECDSEDFETELGPSAARQLRIVEGDLIQNFADCRVFVARLPTDGQRLLRVASGPRRVRLRPPARMSSYERALTENWSPTQKPDESESHWQLAPGYEEMLLAHMVVLSLRSGDPDVEVDAFLADAVRIRRDRAVFADVADPRCYRSNMTIVAADLADAGHAGTRKAIARVRRLWRGERR